MAKLVDIFKRKQGKPAIQEVITAPKQTDNNNVIIKDLYTSQVTLLENTDIASLDESKLITLYRQMENDAIISAALDLYADSATQVNVKTGHVIAIESHDKTFEREINNFLWDSVKIDTEAWQFVRDVARDGKIFLDTQVDTTDWSFVPVNDPSTIKALTLGQDKIKYFVVKPSIDSEQKQQGQFSFIQDKQAETLDDYIVEGKDRYIAGFNSRENKGTMTVSVEGKYDEDGNPKLEELTIRSGRSILANVVQTFQTLSALEDAMFLNRLTKSTQFKIVQIDVGENTDNKQAKQMIDSVKNAFKSSETIDQSASRYQNRQSPIPVNDFIYVPTKGTKGAVKVDTVGGETVEGKTADIDYYRNKLFAGLGVLKAYLGFEETTPGGLGDSTLTKLDERYGKRVQRLQQVLSHIVKQMIEYYWRYSSTSSLRTLENIPKYKIILGKVSTKEEEENRARLKDSIDIGNSIIAMAKDEFFVKRINQDKLFTYIFEDIIGLDTSMFSADPNAEEIEVNVHELEAKKGNVGTRKIYESGSFINDVSDLLSNINEAEVRAIFDEYDVFLESNGSIIPFNVAMNLSRYNRAMLLEATYKQLKSLSKTKDPERLAKSKKLTAKYTGIDSENNITFVVTAEDPEKNKAEGKPTSYVTKVSLKDLLSTIKATQENDEKVTDKEIIFAAIQGDIDVSCECPAFKYWGSEYNGTKGDYSLTKNNIPPTRNIPTQVICKHTVLTLTVLPFWYNTIIRDLRNKGILPSSKDTKVKVNKKQNEIEADNIENLEDVNKEK